MSDTNETIADIIAEMRFHGQQNIDAEKDKPEYGILTVEGRIILNYADRFDAAWKRAHEALEFIAHYNDNEAQMDDPCCADGHILAGKAKEALGMKEQEGGAK